MDTNRILPGQSQPPQHISGAKGKDGEQAFHDLARSKGNTPDELAQATDKRINLTRGKRGERTTKRTSLFLVKDEDENELEEEAIYYTVLDPTTGQIMTLRLLAVA